VEPSGLGPSVNYDASYTYAGAFEVMGAGQLFPVKYSQHSAIPGWNGCPGSIVWAVTGTSGSHLPGTFTLLWNGLTDFSDFTAAGNNVPLPVELLSLQALQKDSHIEVEWITLSEINNHYFELQRHTGSGFFTPLGIVNGNGTTSMTHRYSFTDENPARGLNYYRLRQVDFDGTSKYSEQVAVDFRGRDAQTSAYYHGISGSLMIEPHEDGRLLLNIYDGTGKVIITHEMVVQNGISVSLALPGVSAGVYQASVVSATGAFATDCNSLGIDCEVTCVGQHPVPRLVAVIDCRRVWVLGCQAILGRDHQDS
jgi:hypothetical protein